MAAAQHLVMSTPLKGMTMSPLNTSSPLRRMMAMATLALAGTAALAAPPERGMGMHGLGGPGMARLLEQIGASAEQRTQIEAIMKSARDDLRSQHEQGRALREQMQALFVQPTVDANAVEALRQQMLARHDAASRRMTQAMLEASAVLGVEQRQQLAAAMAQRAERGPKHRHGGERPGA